MRRRHTTQRFSTFPAVFLLVAAVACGSSDDGTTADGERSGLDAGTSQPIASQPIASQPIEPEGGGGEGAGCVLDEATVGDAIGIDVVTIGDCDFGAGAVAGEAVAWSVEVYHDPTVPESLQGGAPVEGLADAASWNDALGVLSVQDGATYFQVQPLRLGDAPITLGARELAEAVARLVIERS